MSIRMCRLFFWIAGAPENRPGGPWWYRDFFSDEDRTRFIDDVRRFLHEFVCCDDQLIPYGVDKRGGMIIIEPPPKCEMCKTKRVDMHKQPEGCPCCGWSGIEYAKEVEPSRQRCDCGEKPVCEDSKFCHTCGKEF